MGSIRKDNWAAGANNIAQENRLPEGSAARIVNFDPAVGGTLELCAGFTKQVECERARAVFSLRDDLVFVDGGELKVMNRGGIRVVASIAESGPVVGAELNGKLYLSTATENLVFDGSTVKPWGIQTPAFEMAIIAGSLPAGVYRVAVTALGDDESGADVMIVTLPGSSGLMVRSSAAGDLRLYASVANGETLYSQGALNGERQIVTTIADDTEVLGTAFLTPMPQVDVLVACGSVLMGAKGRYLFRTEPFMPHLCDPVRGFFQYADDVTLLAPAEPGGVFVCADKTFFLQNPESESLTQQRGVLEFGGSRGTLAILPNGSPAWFTHYGQAIGGADGSVRLPNKTMFAPDISEHGAAGLLDHNGNQLVVTSFRGPAESNQLAAADFWGVEIVDERTD